MRRLGVNDLNLLEALFANLDGSPFYVKDSSLRYRAANDAMARLCGVGTRREMIGRCASDFYPPDDVMRHEAVERAVLRTAQPSPTMIDFIAGPDPAWLVFENHPLVDAHGKGVGVAGTAYRLHRKDFLEAVYRRVLTVSETLRADPGTVPDLHTLAALAGVSAAQLQRDFTKVFRMPISRFVRQLRLAKARRLLLTDMSIAEVAHDVGFTDHSAFSRCFHQELGMPPRTYRRQRRLQPSPQAKGAR